MNSSNPEMLYPFPHSIFISPKPPARTFAHSIHHLGSISRTLTIWVDGSACLPPNSSSLPCAGALLYIDPITQQWQEQITISNLSSPTNAKLVALCLASECAAKLTDHFDHMLVFTDSQQLLLVLKINKLEVVKNFDGLLFDRVLTLADTFVDAGIQVDLHGLPGRCVEAHRRVDSAARKYWLLASEGRRQGLLKVEIAFELAESGDMMMQQVLHYLRGRYRDALKACCIRSEGAKAAW